MTDLLTALALVLVIEGLVLALFPALPRRMIERMAELPPEVLRLAGLTFAIIGVGCVWLLRG
jgi:uncharacterized protein YjeT (DUF2065 family)